MASFISKRKRGKKLPTKKDDMAQIVRQINKEIRDVNDMLERLYRHGEKNTWASKRLLARLNTVRRAVNPKTKQLRVVDLNRKLTVGEIREYQKSLQAFKESETSTIRGIRRIENRVKDKIRQTVTTIDEQGKLNMPTKKETEALYNLFEDKNFQDLTETIKASDLWGLLTNAKEMNDTPENFVENVSNYVLDIEDEDIKNALKHVYQNFLRESE